MATFSVSIATDNAAFGETPEDRDQEIARILRQLAGQLDGLALLDIAPTGLKDANGNTVGIARLEEN